MGLASSHAFTFGAKDIMDIAGNVFNQNGLTRMATTTTTTTTTITTTTTTTTATTKITTTGTTTMPPGG